MKTTYFCTSGMPPTTEDFWNESMVRFAGFDIVEQDCVCRILSEAWNGHPAGSVVVSEYRMTRGARFVILDAPGAVSAPEIDWPKQDLPRLKRELERTLGHLDDVGQKREVQSFLNRLNRVLK